MIAELYDCKRRRRIRAPSPDHSESEVDEVLVIVGERERPSKLKDPARARPQLRPFGRGRACKRPRDVPGAPGVHVQRLRGGRQKRVQAHTPGVVGERGWCEPGAPSLDLIARYTGRMGTADGMKHPPALLLHISCTRYLWPLRATLLPSLATAPSLQTHSSPISWLLS